MKRSDLYDRRGKFSISRSLMFDDFDNFAKLMKDFVVLDVETNLAEDFVVYSGAHPDFDVIEKYHITPTYTPILETDIYGSILNVKWNRIKD